MGKSEQIISQAVTHRYHNSEKTKLEALNVLKHYRGLSPKLDRFVFNDGTDRQLLNLDGTIPVRYKGSAYNIPICLWLLDNHPNSAPMVYVKPTADMLIKASRHVDQNGKVYLPYLHEWSPTGSDVLGLIQMMIMTFAEVCPVYAKPKGAPAPFTYPAQQSAFGSSSPGVLPYPAGPQTGAPTPYPTNPFMPAPATPYPLYPTAGPTPYPPAAASTPYPVSPNPTPYPPYSSPGATFPAPPTTTRDMPVTQGNNGTISDEHIRVSLLSAVGDRVRMRLRDIYGGAQAEVSVLRQQQTDLNHGKVKLDSLMTKIANEQAELNKCIKVLKDKETDLKMSISKLSETTDPLDLDDAVTTTAPVYKQLLNAYAEDQATQDAIYYLGEALRRDVIDMDTYLKHVRSLSRKQFQLRAIMMKCRMKANLSP